MVHVLRKMRKMQPKITRYYVEKKCKNRDRPSTADIRSEKS